MDFLLDFFMYAPPFAFDLDLPLLAKLEPATVVPLFTGTKGAGFPVVVVLIGVGIIYYHYIIFL